MNHPFLFHKILANQSARWNVAMFLTIIVKSVGKVNTFDLSFASLPHPPFSMLYKTELFECVIVMLYSNSEKEGWGIFRRRNTIFIEH